jgi:hypothetical protein
MMSGLDHTDARDQARFRALPTEEQMLEIWLNTRETNGHVAETMRDVHELQMWRTDELIPWMATVDRKLISAATLATALVTAATSGALATLGVWTQTDDPKTLAIAGLIPFLTVIAARFGIEGSVDSKA